MPEFISIKTSVPGPRSIALMELRKKHIPDGIYHATPIFVDHADGALITDVDGNTYLDFAGGIGTMNAGHCNPEVVRNATEQIRKITHSCFSVAPYESYVRLAEKLNAITPGSFPKKTMFANSGAEGVENAVKIARHHTRREGVLVFEHAFHGRTLLTMSMTSKVKPYKFGFGPFAPEIYRLPYPDEYRADPQFLSAHLEEFFSSHVAAENVACVVMELVLGEGGFIVAPRNYVKKLEQLCRKYGILLVIDEVQTGFGRTAKMFACEHYGLEPDLIILAKSLAGGLPLSAVTGRAEIMDSAQVGGLGGTYTGNPVSCAAALSVIDFMEKEEVVKRAGQIARLVEQKFQQFYEKYPFIGESRGLGAMRALEIVKDRTSKLADKERTNEIARRCYENGLILLTAGTYGNVLRTLMPLVITDDQLKEGLEVIEYVLQ